MGQKRNYGIDLLRIVATLMVIILHILGVGGVIYTIDATSPIYEVAWFMEFLAYCAVNCYALISGYVGVDSKFKISNIIQLWLQVVATTVGITVCFGIFGAEVTKENVLQAILPVAKQTYWYFTAYFCVFWLSPFLAKMVKNMGKKSAYGFLICTMVLFSLMPTFMKTDMFFLRSGYTASWLVILYVVGGIVKTYFVEMKIKRLWLVFCYLGSTILTLGAKLMIEWMSTKTGFSMYESNFLMNYNSPTIVLAALSLLLLFKDMRVERGSKVIAFFAPFTFGIYIIHVQPYVWNYIMANRFVGLTKLHPIVLIVAVLGIAAAIFIICSIIEFIRISVFKLIRIPQLCKRIEEIIRQMLNKVKE